MSAFTGIILGAVCAIAGLVVGQLTGMRVSRRRWTSARREAWVREDAEVDARVQARIASWHAAVEWGRAHPGLTPAEYVEGFRRFFEETE